MPVELKSDYLGDRTARTQLPGGPAPSTYGLPPAILAQLLVRMRAGQQQRQPQGQSVRPMADAQPDYNAPVMGTSRAGRGGGGGGEDSGPEDISRMVWDPQANPYEKMATGFEPQKVRERYIPGVGWEFEGLRPHGSSGGFQGGGAESTLHADPNLERQNYLKGEMTRRQDLESTNAPDSRGEGYGFMPRRRQQPQQAGGSLR